MDKKSKTRGPPKTAERPKGQAKEQSERFIETARALDVDETGRKFDAAFKKMASRKAVKP